MLFIDWDTEISMKRFGIFLWISRFKGVDAAGLVDSELVVIHGVSAFSGTYGYPGRFIKRRIGACSHQKEVVMKSFGKLGSSVKRRPDPRPLFPLLEHPAISVGLNQPVGFVPWVCSRPSTSSKGWRGPAPPTPTSAIYRWSSISTCRIWCRRLAGVSVSSRQKRPK